MQLIRRERLGQVVERPVRIASTAVSMAANAVTTTTPRPGCGCASSRGSRSSPASRPRAQVEEDQVEALAARPAAASPAAWRETASATWWPMLSSVSPEGPPQARLVVDQ